MAENYDVQIGWSELIPDLLSLIATKPDDVTDFYQISCSMQEMESGH
jgi:hypothetical protein